MAGSYPDVPGRQIMYDRDGSVGFRLDSGVLTALSGADLIALNNEDGGDGVGDNTTRQYGIIFPELHDVVGFYICTASGGDEPARAFQTSTDTTTGLDGTWTTVIAGTPTQSYNGTVEFRSLIQSVTWSGIRGVRWSAGRSQRIAQFYGAITAGQTPDRLRLWHPTLDEELAAAALDFGNTPRSSLFTKTFRVKNNSSGLTANTVTVSREALTDPSPDTLSALTIDNAGSGYATSQNIGSLAPGAISGVISLRLNLGSSARLGLGRQRIKAAAASWS